MGNIGETFEPRCEWRHEVAFVAFLIQTSSKVAVGPRLGLQLDLHRSSSDAVHSPHPDKKTSGSLDDNDKSIQPARDANTSTHSHILKNKRKEQTTTTKESALILEASAAPRNPIPNSPPDHQASRPPTTNGDQPTTLVRLDQTQDDAGAPGHRDLVHVAAAVRHGIPRTQAVRQQDLQPEGLVPAHVHGAKIPQEGVPEQPKVPRGVPRTGPEAAPAVGAEPDSIRVRRPVRPEELAACGIILRDSWSRRGLLPRGLAAAQEPPDARGEPSEARAGGPGVG